MAATSSKPQSGSSQTIAIAVSEWAARAGQVVAYVAMISGVVFVSFWNLLIGWFLLRSASQALQSSKVQEALSQYTVADVVDEGHLVIGLHDSLRQLANQAIPFQGKVKEFLVTDDHGQLVGLVDLEQLKTVPTSQWPQVPVQEILQSTAVLPQTVQDDQSLLDIVMLFDKEKTQALAVVKESGALVGLLEKAAVRRYLQQGIAPA